MNETQLRDRLRSATADVMPEVPAPQALRQMAHHRRRRTQTGLASLVVLVLAAAGVGLGFGLHHRPTPVQTLTQRTADVTVACTPGAVTLTLGQTLAVAPCPDSEGHAVGAVPYPAAHPPRAVPQPFHFDRPGTFAFAIQYTGCADPVRGCLFNLRRFGMISVTVVARGEQNVAVPCRNGSVHVVVGQQLGLKSCPVGSDVGTSGAALDVRGGNFVAVTPGFEEISISYPPCILLPALKRSTCAGGVVHVTISVTVDESGVKPTSPQLPTVTSKGSPPVTPSMPPVSPPLRERALPCTTSDTFEIPVGETLVLTDCPVDAHVTSNGSALSNSGHTFTAVTTGRATIQISFAACDLVPTAAKRSGCAGGPSGATINVRVTGPLASGSPPR